MFTIFWGKSNYTLSRKEVDKLFAYMRDLCNNNFIIYLLIIFTDSRLSLEDVLFKIKKNITMTDFVYTHGINVCIMSLGKINEDIYKVILDDRLVYGVSTYPKDGFTLKKLEDVAKYNVKNQGVFNLLYNFNKGMLNEEVFLHYQPIVDIEKRIVAVEGLVRWYNNGKIMFPNDFIHDVETSCISSRFTSYVLKKAIIDLKLWDRDIKIHINVSADRLSDSDFCKSLFDILNDYYIDRRNIVLELTELYSLYDYRESKKVIKQLKDKGISIAVDDLGVKHSSLSYLNDFDIDILKIDKGLLVYDNWVKLLLPIIQVAESKGVKIVVEGVETEDQFNKLKEIGVDYIQGYYISKPISSLEFNFMLKKGLV